MARSESQPRMYHPDLEVTRDGYVTTVTIDRPGSKNACTGDMWVAIGAAFREIAYSGARVVVLTGAGGNFCAGADLTPAANGDETPALPPHNVHNMRVLGEAVLAVYQCPVPVIAKVQGVCV